MRSFVYHTPTKIVFGREAEKKAAECVREAGASRVLIVYGSERIRKSGLLGTVTEAFDQAGIAWETLGGVVANPRLGLVREGVKKALSMKAELILAIGGGSVIDTAKAVAAGTANPETDVWEFWSGRKKLEKDLPIASILTFAAAGSETSNSAVITNEETKEKRGITNEIQRPVFAIMNPELTSSLPVRQIAAGVTDIMMHTLERYFVPWQGNHLSDAMAAALLKTIVAYGPLGVQDSNNYEAMSEIMWCGSISHIDLTGLGCQPPEGGRPGDWATHQLGHELGGKYDCTHGETLSVMWGPWARYVCDADYARFAKFGRELWGITCQDEKEAAAQAIEKTVDFFRSLGMPTSFSELGIGLLTEEEVDELAENCSFRRTRTIGCMKALDYQAMREIYRMANH